MGVARGLASVAAGAAKGRPTSERAVLRKAIETFVLSGEQPLESHVVGDAQSRSASDAAL